MATETVIVNNYGDTAEQIVLEPGWRSEYERYLAGYEQAEDKAAFNSLLFDSVVG